MKNSVAKQSALVMPSHYVELDEEEMSYIDGGGDFQTKWWGTRIHLSRSEADALGYALGLGYGVAGLITSFIPEQIVSKILAVCFFANTVAISTALIVCNGDNGINIDFSWFHYAAFLTSGAGLSSLIFASAIRKA